MCQKVVDQFENFIDSIPGNGNFVNFDRSSDRVDTLFYDSLNDDNQYGELWNTLKLVLFLSHGQGTVERGFSVNRDTSEVNMNGDTLIAKRLIKDHIQSVGGFQKFEISSQLLVYAAGARRR